MTARLDKCCKLVERQLGLGDDSKNRNAPAISHFFEDKPDQYSDIKEQLTMQTYHNGSVTSGHITGEQCLVCEYHFVDCAAHIF